MFHVTVYLLSIIFIFSIRNQHACEVTEHTDINKNKQGVSSITLNCDHECKDINQYLGLFYFKLRKTQIINFEKTIQKATELKSNFIITQDSKAVTFFNTTWKRCYKRHNYLKIFFINIYSLNLTDFTGYFIRNPKIDGKSILGPHVLGEDGSPLLVSNRGIVIVFGDWNYLETKLHHYMKEAFEIRLRTPQITNYILHTRQISLKGTIKEFTTYTHMQRSEYSNSTKHNNEPVNITQSDSGITRVIILIIFVFFTVISLKFCCNFRTEPIWQYPETENTETFTLEPDENVGPQIETQYEEREETTL